MDRREREPELSPLLPNQAPNPFGLRGSWAHAVKHPASTLFGTATVALAVFVLLDLKRVELLGYQQLTLGLQQIAVACEEGLTRRPSATQLLSFGVGAVCLVVGLAIVFRLFR